VQFVAPTPGGFFVLGFVAQDQTNTSADSLECASTSRLGKCSAQLLSIFASSIGFISILVGPDFIAAEDGVAAEVNSFLDNPSRARA
jgi:hypothetical protein